MIYLYAVIDRPSAPIPATIGLCGAATDALQYRDIAAVISPLTTTQIQATEDNLWRHEMVLEELMTDRSVLPVQFGAVFTDELSALAVMDERYADFAANLNRVRGRVELGLRALWDDPLASSPDSQPSDDAVDGRAYMLDRVRKQRDLQARRQEAEAFAETIHGSIARLADESGYRLQVSPSPYLNGAYLVKREAVATFRQEVETLASTYPKLCLLCTGPWPPFSFVNGKQTEDTEGNEKWRLQPTGSTSR
ncbi:MAG: GvpL/GvpF family gas vesicle protein [Armatimonadota bacterium]|nr:GvpL/GvpF family gas vesicle protein [Armatimonadota bacterium]